MRRGPYRPRRSGTRCARTRRAGRGSRSATPKPCVASPFQSESSGKSSSSTCAQAMCVHGESREIPNRRTPASVELRAPVTQELQLVRSGRRPVEEVEEEEQRAFLGELLRSSPARACPPRRSTCGMWSPAWSTRGRYYGADQPATAGNVPPPWPLSCSVIDERATTLVAPSPVRMKTHWSALSHDASTQRPSGDQATLLMRPAPQNSSCAPCRAAAVGCPDRAPVRRRVEGDVGERAARGRRPGRVHELPAGDGRPVERRSRCRRRARAGSGPGAALRPTRRPAASASPVQPPLTWPESASMIRTRDRPESRRPARARRPASRPAPRRRRAGRGCGRPGRRRR